MGEIQSRWRFSAAPFAFAGWSERGRRCRNQGGSHSSHESQERSTHATTVANRPKSKALQRAVVSMFGTVEARLVAHDATVPCEGACKVFVFDGC
ncbi:hypothetical protein ABT063_38290 [Streptomyces sp. NPDC002838]|uniref:hypothetical protein n=1 Tax=Streptomyces sp. NPDC002838 TaxID=3154436 RepID=UPI0033223B89